MPTILEQRLDSFVLEGQDVKTAWAALRDTVYNTAMECLGTAARKHKDWFDENCTEIQQLLVEKRRAYKAHLDDPKSAPQVISEDFAHQIIDEAQLFIENIHSAEQRINGVIVG